MILLTHYRKQNRKNYIMRLIEALDYGIEELKNYSDSPQFEATILLEEVSGKSREEILIKNETLNKAIFLEYENLVKRRITGEPFQYIIRKVNFLGIDIFITPKTFIPRPETEFMAHYAIFRGRSIENPKILEIGTGSGAIAVSLALKLSDSLIFATDISEDALNICKKNIAFYQLENRILTIHADTLVPFRMKKQFDIIISNPPYIPARELPHLPNLVKREPFMALNGGKNGVHTINRILASVPLLLKEEGTLYLELTEANIPYLDIPEELDFRILDDQFGRKRIFRARKK